MKIHAGDTVRIMNGRDRGVVAKVQSVDHDRNTILVEGVNRVYKHVKPSQKNPQGGRLHKEMPINAAKAMVVCPKTNQATRVGFRYLDDGSKERYAKVSGASLGIVSPPKQKYAKQS